LRVVDGARADDDQESVIALLDDLNGLVAAGADGVGDMFGLFAVSQTRREEGIVL
jgi:hypothetical protein